jgi:hypothetical protein
MQQWLTRPGTSFTPSLILHKPCYPLVPFVTPTWALFQRY